jgi:hypothetical protein
MVWREWKYEIVDNKTMPVSGLANHAYVTICACATLHPYKDILMKNQKFV